MFLILDFTQSLRLAIIHNSKIVSKVVKTKKNISEILIFEIDKFLEKTKSDINSIKSICVVTGPGSFTGIRTALTFSKSLNLIKKIDIFGVSKFEIINYKIKTKKFNKKKCILLHFKNNQFFMQTFEGNKALDEVKLVNLANKEFRYNKETTYIYDSILFEAMLGNYMNDKTKNDFYLVDYSLIELEQIILNKSIDNLDPKPLYISNYY